MSRPYVPGVWAKQYEALPAARKDAVNREVNQIFADRTGVTGKLDPKRDTDLVRIWLRIRDAVMSGATKVPARLLLKIEGYADTSRSRGGWAELVSATSTNPRFGNSGTGPTPARAPAGMIVSFDDKKSPELYVAIAHGLSRGMPFDRVLIRCTVPSLVLTTTLEPAFVGNVSQQGKHIQAKLFAGRVRWDFD